MTSSARTVPSIGWMLMMSTWMISTVIPGSLLAWLGFLIIGIIGRMRRWTVAGIALGAAAILATLPLWGQWQSLVAAIVYLGGMLLALAANPSWLRAMWARAQNAAQATPATAATTRAASRPAPEQNRAARRRSGRGRPRAVEPDSAGAVTERTSVSTETEQLADRAGASTAEYFAEADADSAEPIDVNTADAGALAGLPGITRGRARSLVKQRERQGGFVSLDAFATAAGLQPHELVRLRRVAVCSPPARGPRRFGRRVDY